MNKWGERGPKGEDRSVWERNYANQSMRAAKPKTAAPPIILTPFEAALLGFAEVLAEGLADEVGVVAFEAPEEPGAVDVGKGIEEVKVTP